MTKNTQFLKPTLTIMITDDEVTIEVSEGYSKVITLTTTHRDFMRALGRLADVPCTEGVLLRPDVVGKVEEHKPLEFPLPGVPTTVMHQHRVAAAEREALRLCPKGWTSDQSFSSQDSFFKKDGKYWARTTIRRWVKPSK